MWCRAVQTYPNRTRLHPTGPARTNLTLPDFVAIRIHPSRDIRGIRAEPILNPFPLSAAQPSPATAKVSSNQQPADRQPAGGCCTLTDLCLFSLLSWTPSGTYDIRQQSTTAVAHAGRGAEEKGAGQRGRGTRKLSTKERT